METYLITFQLKSNEIYATVAGILRSFPKWARIMENVWIVRSEENALSMRDKLSSIIKEVGGTILVLQISEDNWASYALSQEVADWMKQNI